VSKQKARKGELSGKYGVFYGSNSGTGPTYAVVAQIGKLAALNVENDSVYEWERSAGSPPASFVGGA
jgi:hypothetical protein